MTGVYVWITSFLFRCIGYIIWVMDKRSVYFSLFILVAVSAVIGFKYKQFFLDKDFVLIANIPCDPAIESCFRVICDGECDDSMHIVNSDGSPYKKVTMHASYAPECLESENCTDFTCPAEDETCTIDTCSEETIEEGEECYPFESLATPSVEEGEVLIEGSSIEGAL